MRRSSPLQSVLRNPTLVGAITVLVVILAVFLAYNANSGLPFVATYRITAEVPNAASIVPGNEVRIGGVRVGLVEDVVPIPEDDGGVKAGLVTEARPDVEPLPTDSTVVIRARSALGLKYLEINRGTSDEGYPGGRRRSRSRRRTPSRSSTTSCSTPSTRRPARRSRSTSTSSATRSPAAARTQRGDRRCPSRCCRGSSG